MEQNPEPKKRVYGRPWPKGTSGNPNGRPPGVGLMSQLNALLDDEDGVRRFQLMAKLLTEAAGGNMYAMKLILDRTDPVKALELTVNNNAMTAAGIREYLDSIEVRPIKAKARRNGNGRGANSTA